LNAQLPPAAPVTTAFWDGVAGAGGVVVVVALLMYSSSRLPAPQYCKGFPEQGMEQSDKGAGREEESRVLLQ
jgi:hypothetical protein